MAIILRVIKGIFWVIYAWQIFTLLPVLTWIKDLSAVTGEMWAGFGIKITVLIICYFLYRFFDKKSKAIITTKASKEIPSITTSIAKIPKEYAIIGVSAVAVFLVVFIIINSFGASTYEDCILEKLEGVGSDKAAIYIRQACRKKFPLKSNSGSSRYQNPENPFDLGPAKIKYSSDEIDRFLEDVKIQKSSAYKITKKSQAFIDFQKEKAEENERNGLSFMNYYENDEEKAKQDEKDFLEFEAIYKRQNKN